MAFKSFRFLDEYEKKLLKEAEGDEDIQNTDAAPEGSDESAEMSQDGPEMSQDTEENPEGDPKMTPDVDEGIFISDLKKAEWTKMLLAALMTPKPTLSTISEDDMNVTTENADKIIQIVKNAIKLGGSEDKLDAELNQTI